MAEQEIPGLVPTTETDLTTINRHKYLHATSRVQVIGYSILVQHRNEKDALKRVRTVSLYPCHFSPSQHSTVLREIPLGPQILSWEKGEQRESLSDIPSLSECYP